MVIMQRPENNKDSSRARCRKETNKQAKNFKYPPSLPSGSMNRNGLTMFECLVVVLLVDVGMCSDGYIICELCSQSWGTTGEFENFRRTWG